MSSTSSTDAGVAPSARDARWWPLVKRVATWSFFALVAWLIVDHARAIDWDDAWRALLELPRGTLLLATGCVVASYIVYSVYDLLGRTVMRHGLGVVTVMGVTFIAYAFNMNLGSLVGTVGMRYRLYSRLGLDNETIARVTGFSMFTNWVGYLLIAGTLFAFGAVTLPPGWMIDSGGLRLVGVALAAIGLAYPLLCAFGGPRTFTVRGHAFSTPGWRMALLQMAVSMTNWSLMGATMWVLLRDAVPFPQVLAVLLVAAVAGLVTHVPAGLGVIEAVFLALLGGQVPQGRLLGALLAYRALYYLLPLAVAALFYLVTELRARKLRARSAPTA